MTVENGLSPMGALLAATAHNAGVGTDIAIATGQVIAKRMALGMAAVRHPGQADHVEFGRMIPEKVEAFSAAGSIMVERSGRAGQQFAQFASTEMAMSARAAIAMATCGTPMAVARAQGDFVRGWLDRAASNFIAIGMTALRTQDLAMAPIRAAVVGNAERLAG